MERYIVLGIIALMILAPKVIWELYMRRQRWRSIGRMTSQPFVCPNCGHRFYMKDKVVFHAGENKAYLKCPSCGKRSFCGRPYDFEEH